jgi:hypothetical protein
LRLLRSGRRSFFSRRRSFFSRRSAIADDRNRLANRHSLAFRHQNLLERAALECLEFHRGLVGLDLGNDLAVGDSVTGLLQPAPN